MTCRLADRDVGGFFTSNWHAELIASVHLDEALLSEIVDTSTPDQTSVAPASIGLTPPIEATNAEATSILGSGTGGDGRSHNNGDCQSYECFCQRGGSCTERQRPTIEIVAGTKRVSAECARRESFRPVRLTKASVTPVLR